MRIRIVGLPNGTAPEWARQAWIGMELDAEDNAPKSDLETLIKRRNLPAGYEVDRAAALKALERRNEKASLWWKAQFPQPACKKITFRAEICEKVRP